MILNHKIFNHKAWVRSRYRRSSRNRIE